jgi:hypothetical protein
MNDSLALQWVTGEGWLILAGAPDAGSAIRAKALGRLRPRGGVAYIGLSDISADAIMDDLDDLGAPTGYLVDLLAEDDDDIFELLNEASMIVLDGREPVTRLLDALRGPAILGMLEAYRQGAVIYAEGSSAALFGLHWLDRIGTLQEGMGWLNDALVIPADISRDQLNAVAAPVFRQHPRTLAFALPDGSAVALGPEGFAEVWGDSPVAITLGPGFLSRPDSSTPQ